MMRSIAALMALALLASPVAAQTTAVQLGTGFAYGAFVGPGVVTVTEGNVASFLEIEVALDDGTFSGEYDVDGLEIWNPDTYMSLGYTIQGAADPVQGIYVMPLRRIGASDLFVGVGAQMEIWNASLFGDTIIAPGVRAVLELPGVTETVPFRLATSYVWGDAGRRRVELSLTGTP